MRPEVMTAVSDNYSNHAHRYAKRFSDPLRGPSVERTMLEQFARGVASVPSHVVADIGCGPGNITPILKELGVRSVGVDISPSMTRLANKANPDTFYATANAGALPFGTGTLTGVISRFTTIHHAPADLPILLTEYARVLTTGGLLIFSTFHTPGPEHTPRTIPDFAVPIIAYPTSTYFEMLVQAGFGIMACRSVDGKTPDAPSRLHVLATSDGTVQERAWFVS